MRRYTVLLTVLLIILSTGTIQADGPSEVTYQITIENLTNGQPFSPPIVAVHGGGMRYFKVGAPASEAIQAIAENGNNGPLQTILDSSNAVGASAQASAPLVPASNPGGADFDSTVTLKVTAAKNFRFLSMAAMLICTNDGFTGLDRVKLPRKDGESREFFADAYDAGTEMNTEDFIDMVPPCQGLIGVSSDDPGTGASNPALAEGNVIRHHPGIMGIADLMPEVHEFATDGPVAKITITRLAPVEHYRVTVQNLTHGQPMSPPVAATHSRGSPRMFKVGKKASLELEAIAEDGNQGPMVDLFAGSDRVTQVVDVGMPLTRNGTTVGDFMDAVTFDIAAHPDDRFSIATMLICSNDGFTGLHRRELPHQGSDVFLTDAYDAGTENNTEVSEDLVDPCSLLGPTELPGDPDSNRNDDVATSPTMAVQAHPNVQGAGELSTADHGWTGPVAKVTTTRITEDGLRFRTRMTPQGEVPIVQVSGNPRGGGRFILSADETSLHYELNVRNITGVTQAHIHHGLPNENGDVVAVLFGPVDPPTGSVDGKIAEGTINVDADFVTALRNGELYVNVHTVANPSGEIRGQIGAIDR